MGSVSFNGPYTGWNGSANVGNCWHKSPTMFGSGTISAGRDSDNGSIIHISISANCSILSGSSYGYPVIVRIYANGNIIRDIAAPSGGSWHIDDSFDITTNDAVTFGVHYICGQSGGCTKGYGDVDMGGRLYEGSYNPTPPYYEATMPTWGQLNTSQGSTNYGTVNCKPDTNIMVQWAGEAENSDHIEEWALTYECGNKTSGSKSVLMTRTNKGDISGVTFQLRNFWDSLGRSNVRPGRSVHFYVNMRTRDRGWWSDFYIGSMYLYRDGVAYYVTANNQKKEVVAAYYRPSSGDTKKCRYGYYRTSSGATKVIDFYTELY